MPETTNRGEIEWPPKWVWWTLAGLSLPTFLLGLSVPFLGPDEPRYAQVAREMMDRRDWITPTLAGRHWFEKPPLLYWVEIACFRIFGVNEFAAHFGPALMGLATVVCLWLLGRSLNIDYGKWLALVATSTLGLIVFAHGATTDIAVTFPMTAALVSFFVFDRRAVDGESVSRLFAPLAALYMFVGLSLLGKGLIGIIFPVAIISLYYLFSRRWPSKTLFVSLIWGLAISTAVAATWYLPMYLRHGWEFIDEFIIKQHFQRFTTNEYQHPQPFYFYLYILPLMVLPWLPLCVAAIVRAIKTVLRQDENSSPASSLTILAICWLAVPLVFFSFSGSKLPGYVLPALPGAVILCGIAVRELASKSKGWAYAGAALAGITMLTISVLLVTIVPNYASCESGRQLIVAADQKGYSSEPVLVMHSYFYNAEFYATTRLDHDARGKQVRLFGTAEVKDEIRRRGGGVVLVLVPNEYLSQLTEDPHLNAESIGSNEDGAIVAVGFR
ncbi:MAG TPA: glycosyltransferase family 39 protein [Pyrinomonadaceae bacterium]|jgi:4-amino-4-deoxy-L-arabinose transferase-like glycosyltransferase|nr:glycosyltransferase family 39 protein [Pyrinomonadaceae bacterium]